MPHNVTSMMCNRLNGPPWHNKGVPVEGLATAADEEAWRAMAQTPLARRDAERYFRSVFRREELEEEPDDGAIRPSVPAERRRKSCQTWR
jgi:hypothetical protein